MKCFVDRLGLCSQQQQQQQQQQQRRQQQQQQQEAPLLQTRSAADTASP
jgi:hypothetical protein